MLNCEINEIPISIKIGFANKSVQEIKGILKSINEDENEKVIIFETNSVISKNIFSKHIKAWTLSIYYHQDKNDQLKITKQDDFIEVLIYLINDKENRKDYFNFTIFKKDSIPTETKLQPNGINNEYNHQTGKSIPQQ
ncbi:hypothetical protein ACTFIZ_004086 [Dictyostelium cf. discoideum]